MVYFYGLDDMVRGKAGASTQENYELNLIRDYSRYIHMISSARFDYASIKYLFLVSCTFGECNGEGGLGFNRAAYLKYENNEIIGQMSIGNVSEDRDTAYREWTNLSKFKSRADMYDEIIKLGGDSRQHFDSALDTKLNRIIKEIKINVNGNGADDYFSRAVLSKDMIIIGKDDEKDDYCRRLGAEEAIIAPLKSIEDKVLGMVYVDNNINKKPVLDELKKIAALDVLTSITANHIENMLLNQERFKEVEHGIKNPYVVIGGFAKRIQKKLRMIDISRIYEEGRDLIKNCTDNSDIIIKEIEFRENVLKENEYARMLEKVRDVGTRQPEIQQPKLPA